MFIIALSLGCYISLLLAIIILLELWTKDEIVDTESEPVYRPVVRTIAPKEVHRSIHSGEKNLW